LPLIRQLLPRIGSEWEDVIHVFTDFWQEWVVPNGNSAQRAYREHVFYHDQPMLPTTDNIALDQQLLFFDGGA
jgi:hypothetical protein